MDFDTLDYLATGTPRQQKVWQILSDKGIFQTLQPFTPILTGTIPIGIDNAQSDLDIICCWTEENAFAQYITEKFAACEAFTLRHTQYHGHKTVLANFTTGGFAIEIFGQNRPVKQQEAYRHMIVEHILLTIHGEPLRQEVIRLKNNGLKTEPAFTQALGLTGDPYQTLLTLYRDPL